MRVFTWLGTRLDFDRHLQKNKVTHTHTHMDTCTLEGEGRKGEEERGRYTNGPASGDIKKYRDGSAALKLK